MPVPYDWSKTPKTYLDKNDKIGLLLGAILAGGMGAASGRGGGDSALRGVAGAAAGFGGGANQLEDNYSRMIKEAMDRQAQEYQEDMIADKFGFVKQKYEESEKPAKQSQSRWYDAMSKNTDFDNQMALQKMINEAIEKDKNERYDTRMNQLKMRKMKNEVVASRPGFETKPEKMPDVGNYNKLQAQLAALQSPGNMDYIGLPENERKRQIAILENSIRIMEKRYPDLVTSNQTQATNTSQQNNITEEDIEFTAKKYGITRDEVLKRLGIK